MIKRAKPTPEKLEKAILRKQETHKLLALYQEIWDERPHKSEIDGTWLGNTIKTYFFHHILPKNSCPQLKFSRNNIILLTEKQHTKVGADQNAFPEINRRRDELLVTLLSGEAIIVKQ